MKTRSIKTIVNEVLEDIDELRKRYPGLSSDDKELLDLALSMITNVKAYKYEIQGYNPYQE